MRSLILLLFSTTAFGATADLAVTINAPKTADAQYLFAWSAHVTNNGPDAAPHVKIVTAATFVNGTDCFGLRDLNLDPHASADLICTSYTVNRNGTATVGATVSSDATDPDPFNNSAAASVEWIVGPNLGTAIFPTAIFLDPALPFDLIAQYWNSSTFDAHNVVMTIELPEGATLKSAPDYCHQSSSQLVCSLGTVPGGSSSGTPTTFRIGMIAPDRREGAILSTHNVIAATEPEGDTTNNQYSYAVSLFRTFVVDSTNDSGLGSLRNAIETANASCGDSYPCKVAFRVPTTGVVTIRPETPLPLATANSIDIDGTTQTRTIGDTNPAGPEVFLDGSLLREGDGLMFSTTCSGSVESMAIGNFPEAGVIVSRRQGPCTQHLLAPNNQIAGNYIGVDPTGTTAAPNNRGVVVNIANDAIVNNVISANRRSGIFIANGRSTKIANNIIGLDPAHHIDIGNGGSGVFVSSFGDDADLSGNYIAFNHEFGVAIESGTNSVDLHPNSIFANWQLGIDKGLDGPTAPEITITSAVYDPASNTTEIDVAFTDESTFFPTVQFYANEAPHRSGFGDGQYYLGTARPDRPAQTARFNASGDWRGKWVSATITHNNFYGFARIDPLDEGPDTNSSTSEFSRAVEVH